MSSIADLRRILCPRYATDERWTTACDLAIQRLPARSTIGSAYDQLVTYYTAHLLARADATDMDVGYMIAGPLQSMSVAPGSPQADGSSASYADHSGGDDLLSTLYGQQAAAILHLAGRGSVIYVRGSA